MSAGRRIWQERVQPLIASQCQQCHVGRRFAWASLVGAPGAFTPSETEQNYQAFLDLLNLDAPLQSRLLAKLRANDVFHAGGTVVQPGDATWNELLAWIEQEKADRCPQCGLDTPTQYLAYVEQPEMFWALPRDPFRRDHGLRDRARIMMQPLQPGTLTPVGAPIDFLGESFCGADGRCDFGNISVSHAGDRMVFECRLSPEPADWVSDVRWNICIAEIGTDGRAVNPRFLMPPERRHHGSTISRSDPYGLLLPDGNPLKGPYDQHFQTRRREDTHPVFSPDDTRIYLASRGPDPRTGADATQTYHGTEHLNHIISVRLDGSDPRTIYLNEGGEADRPFFLRNGNIAFHTWNLERMDRHLYTQATADGMMEFPALLGRLQGPNAWGKAVQLGNGGILGVTGRRRSSITDYALFFGDHTLGTGMEAEVPGLRILDVTAYEEIQDFPQGYCTQPPNGPNCTVARFYADPTWAPDGRAFIAHNPERTYVLQGEDMYLAYSQGSDEASRVESMRPYVPKRMGIWLVDHHGALQPVLEPPTGKALRFPAWVGRRHPPRVQPWRTDESQGSAELHIANVPLWFSFRHANGETAKLNLMQVLDTIVSLRVLIKELDGNACLNDNRPYRHAVNNGAHDHPTHLGINNATGYTRLFIPASAGGDGWGDVPLQPDGSVNLRVPAGALLLFQGINAQGHAVAQRSRLLSLPPGHRVDTSVTRGQYASQCMSCHGAVSTEHPFVGLRSTGNIPLVPLDYATTARAQPPVDLTAATRQKTTFLHTIRPLLDAHCVSCHSGAQPAGELSLEAQYSSTANFPAGRWATAAGHFDPAYVAFMANAPVEKRVPGYNYSLSWAWAFREDEDAYKAEPNYAAKMAAHDPLAEVAPWDPAYQNLFAHDTQRFVYLGGYLNANFGRSDRLGGLSSDAWLIEILSGRDLDPVRGMPSVDHRTMLTEQQVRDIMSVLDVGFPFMARCDDRTVPSGPNAGQPWGDATVGP